MDYFAIGQRIRKFRKARGLSQEQLAEKADISVTHMCHIETGNTKLSLPVFAALAEALEVQTDALLYDAPRDTVTRASGEVQTLLETCDGSQARVISETVRALKQAMDAYQ